MRNFAVIVTILSFFVFASTVIAAYQVYSDATVIAGQPFYVKGNISGTTQYNMSVNITGNNANNSFSSGGGYFHVNVSAPTVVGEYNVTVISVNDTSNNKTIRIYVTNISSNFSTITFTRNKPTFSAGASFTINVSMKNTTNS
ncbi:MAG: hypothetical protein HYT73_00705, partial [Candidatus Aenigmarchaeota archaeon]|nr:hypothetical protein [Candidatus Aenigmarchaeota archaeon]